MADRRHGQDFTGLNYGPIDIVDHLERDAPKQMGR